MYVAKFVLLIILVCSAVQAEPLLVFTQENQIKIKSSDGDDVLLFAPAIWGPKWAFIIPSGQFSADNQSAAGSFGGKISNSVPYSYDVRITPVNSRKMNIVVNFSTKQDTELTGAYYGVRFLSALRGEKRLTVKNECGTKTYDLPLGRGSLGKKVEKLEARDESGKVYTITMQEPVAVTIDRDVRIVMAEGKASGSRQTRASLTIELPEDSSYVLTPDAVPMPANWDKWFTWQATASTEPGSVIDMSSWLEAPAGKHGRVMAQGDQLVYNGKPMKFWGVNLCYGACMPKPEIAQQQAMLYAKYGINTVRLHKFADDPAGHGALSKNSFTEYDPNCLADMDNFIAQLKQCGIYTGLSANFGRVKLSPADEAKIPYAGEFINVKKRAWREVPQGALFYAPELLDMQIAQVVNLLNHTNAKTGLKYADDPAILYVELVNENDIYFFGTSALKSPAIKNMAGKAFFEWLKKKYTTEQALVAAWGSGVIGAFKQEKMDDESWSQGVIYPVGGLWYFNPEQLDGLLKPRKARLLDTMQFMYDQQNACYRKFVDAIRATGYKGELVASNWQAGRAFSHFYNLHSDAQVGIVDRHNYYSGPDSMLSSPGSGMLSTGMQQVAGKPFMLSEWIHVFPNEYGVEGPAIIGAYGFGLNGWDVSYMFQNRDIGKFNTELKDQWAVMTPQILGIFPAVSRAVLRQDVRESSVMTPRNVHVPSLAEGKLGFKDKVEQGYDVKEFSSDEIPASALAATRQVVNFANQYENTTPIKMSEYIRDGAIVSAGGQLTWVPGKSPTDGHITINTPGTQAVVGFAEGRTAALSDVSITSRTPFAAIYISALNPNDTIALARSVLITTVARVRNTGMKIVAGSLIERGKGPMLVEPVAAELTFKRSDIDAVYVLDQDGRRTEQKINTAGGKLLLDSAASQTLYYEVVFKNTRS